jgi:hypothetical protein
MVVWTVKDRGWHNRYRDDQKGDRKGILFIFQAKRIRKRASKGNNLAIARKKGKQPVTLYTRCCSRVRKYLRINNNAS